jgi:hypothetical protein
VKCAQGSCAWRSSEEFAITGKPLIGAAALIVLSSAAASSRDARPGTPPANILARTPAFNTSEYHISTDVGVGWPRGKKTLLSSAKLGYDFRSGAVLIPIESPPSNDGLSRRGIEFAAAPKLVAAVNEAHAEVGQTPEVFGRLMPIFANYSSPSAASLAGRLLRIGVDRQTRETLFGPNGALSASTYPIQTEPLVRGVNDQQSAVADSDEAPSGPVQTYPVSAADLADLQSRATRYGAVGSQPDGAKLLANANGAASQGLRSYGTRPLAFDASEGTPLDPLLNTTYDLTHAKVVPSLK